MNEEQYNQGDAAFRSLTNQQSLMVQNVVGVIGDTGQSVSITSYGCGFGMFELALLDKLKQSYIDFTGLDTNKKALATLHSALQKHSKVSKFRLFHASMADAAKYDVASRVGVLIHSIYYLNTEQTTSLMQTLRRLHDKVVVAVTPHNKLNDGFVETLKREHIEPMFADDFRNMLSAQNIAYSEEVLEAQIRLPNNITPEKLRQCMSFIRHRMYSPSSSRTSLLQVAQSLGSEDNGSIVIPHPVNMFVIQ